MCKYDTNISKFKKFKYKTKTDMERRFASAGPNKQMFDMYSMGRNAPGQTDLSNYGYPGVQSQAEIGSLNNDQSHIEARIQSQSNVEEVPEHNS